MKNNAFSIVELAIVSIILFALIGVIIGAAELRKSSEMKRIVADVTKLKASVTEFKNIYGLYPGDFDKAATIWSNCSNSSTYATTCNGDANGYVNATESSLGQTGESVYFYEHLYHADLFEQKFSGNNDNADSYYEISKDNSLYRDYNSQFIYYAVWPNSNSSLNYIDLRIAGLCANSNCGAADNGKPLAGALDVKTAYYIDNKLDDGEYDTGKIQAIIGENFSSNTDSDCDYNSNLTVLLNYCQLKLTLAENY